MIDYVIDDELAVALKKSVRRMVDEGWLREEIQDEIAGFIDEVLSAEDD
jgi:hypothetical protein